MAGLEAGKMVIEQIPREAYGDLAIVRIPFVAIDPAAALAIEEACAEMLPVTALDFRCVRFISSVGLSTLLQFAVAARKKGYKLFALNLSLHHQKMFKLVEIARFMPVADEGELLSHAKG